MTSQTEPFSKETHKAALLPEGQARDVHVGDTAGKDNPTASNEKTIAEVFAMIGFGRFQWQLFLISGLGFMSDSIEVGVISFLEAQIPKEWPEIQGFERNLLSTSVFAGELIGCFIWGPLADSIGRKKTFLISNIGLVTFGMLSAVAPSYWWLVVLRSLVGVAVGGVVVPFDNLAESVEEKHSGTLCFAIEFFWTLGTLYVNGLAAVVIDASWGGWRMFVLLSAAPIVLACLGSCIVEESPAWLLDVGRDDEALAVLNRIAKTNKKDISGVTLAAYQRETDPSLCDIFSPALRRRTYSLSIMWFFGLFGYYGASLANGFIFGDGAGGAEVLFSSCGELVGVVLATLAYWRFGNATTSCVSFLIATLGCGAILATTLTSGETPKILLVLFAFVLRMGVMAGSSVLWVITPPSFPTYIRSSAHSFLFGVGRIGGLLATLWPTTTSLTIVMSAYVFANASCAIAGWVACTDMQKNGDFGTMASDLKATDMDRRMRSTTMRSSHPSAAARPSSLSSRTSRPSWAMRAERPSIGTAA